MIIGLSGTGKTTTTFTTQNGSRPIQDDFVGLMPGGHAYGTENGCFAKTFGLDPDFEPSIYGAVVKSYHLHRERLHGRRMARSTSSTRTTRRTAARSSRWTTCMSYEDARNVGTVDYLLILNRNENIIPAVSKLTREQAAAFFMLGETTGTAAGGAAEEGKFLRVPGTNPFFPLPHGLQGNRLLELLDTHPIEAYLLNTGRVGGKDGDDRSKKLRIPDTSACVKAIAEETIEWTEDPDFGYEVASAVPGLDDVEKLQPRALYERQGRGDRVLVDRDGPQGRPGHAPAAVHTAVRGHHQGGRLGAPRRPRKYPARNCITANTITTTGYHQNRVANSSAKARPASVAPCPSGSGLRRLADRMKKPASDHQIPTRPRTKKAKSRRSTGSSLSKGRRSQ